jgi:uncharacterized protein (DUF2141 family)
MTRAFRPDSGPKPAGRGIRVELLESRQLMSVAVSFVNVAIPSKARRADATLENLRTVDVRLAVTNDEWLAGDLKLALTAGSFYNPKSGGNTAQKQVWGVFPHLEFDTFVAGPNFSQPSVLGRKEGAGAAVFSSREINVSFGDLESTGASTFTMARLTMSKNAAGTLAGSVFLQSDPATPVTFSTTIKPPTPVITGKVYNDTNANGKVDSTEGAMKRWQVFIDADNDGKLDGNEVSVRTNNAGVYKFTNPGNRSHRIRVKVQDGFRRTVPSAGSYNVSLSTGVVASGKDFGATQKGRISGVVFRDADGDRVKDGNESGLSGWRVYIDRDNDSRFDANESNMRSSSAGTYTFNNLSSGTYRVRIVQVGGFARTNPTSGVFNITVAKGADRMNHNFGQRAA